MFHREQNEVAVVAPDRRTQSLHLLYIYHLSYTDLNLENPRFFFTIGFVDSGKPVYFFEPAYFLFFRGLKGRSCFMFLVAHLGCWQVWKVKGRDLEH
jgi:hypothetical protein